ncbi:hypothetical protein [Polyangium jinanense]|uniref:Uncharacterized protein n=1 Tax=Polyangium jinanense TaxID=2829994 RepID=A0A9X3XEY8_9BACT|nr:hypothetical protein [Polyangium jinanense]MDC3960436.1 hypothetical protein [Polyangium jinanense]MDC3986791.1 hypothetical protein [Polyangium jinanense]
MNKKERIEDFAARAEADPNSVFALGSLGRYWAVNPMSDEVALLARLGIEASTCTKVDLYWEHGDVWFVQIQSEAYGAPRKPGAYARLAPSGYVNVVVVVPERVISSDVVTRVLRDVADRSLRIERLRDILQPL